MDHAANTAQQLRSPNLGPIVRWAASAHLAALAAQVALAPAFLAGLQDAYALHSIEGRVVAALGVVVAVAAIANGPSRTGPRLTLIAIAIPVLEAMQLWLGFSAQIAAHVLMGLTIWGLSIAFAVKVWASARA